jgi:hypothetical protein
MATIGIHHPSCYLISEGWKKLCNMSLMLYTEQYVCMCRCALKAMAVKVKLVCSSTYASGTCYITLSMCVYKQYCKLYPTAY